MSAVEAPGRRRLSAGEAPDPQEVTATEVADRSFRVLGALAIVAGVLHAKAAADHAPHYWLFGVFFGVLTCWQTAWGMLVYRAALSRRAMLAGAWVNVAVLLLWLVSRTVGVPFGPWAGEPETVGAIDLMASLDEIVIVAMVAALSAAPSPSLAWLRGGLGLRLGMMLGTASVFAISIGGHTH